jgi:hypothetical protein
MRFIILTAFLMLLATFKGSTQGCEEIKRAIACNPTLATDKWLLNINKRVS